MIKKLTLPTILIAALALSGCSTMNQQQRECTITGKESVSVSSSSSNSKTHEYRVYTEECGTLTVADTLTQGRWDSSEFYSRLKEGETYNMLTGGYRNGFLSMFPNILEAEKVETND